MKTQERIVTLGYSPGHCWYYKLGGQIPYPKQICAAVKISGYRGYAEERIAAADQKPEPLRSEALRQLRDKFLFNLKADLAIYRRRALELSILRKRGGEICLDGSARDIDTSMSLKHNHLYNGFAHLIWLDELLAKQGDLFGF